MEHIPSRYFTDAFTMQDRWYFMRTYKSEKWDKAKAKLSRANKISKNAIAISKAVKKTIGIELFPCIQKIATKGWDISGGTYAFSMVDKDGDTYYFVDRAKYYTQKKYIPSLSGDEIHAELKSLVNSKN